MVISEESRHRMYSRLQEVMGADEAATLMAHPPPVGWADVATKRDLDHLGAVLRGDFARLDARIDHITQVFDARLGEFDARLEAFDARLLAEVARGAGETRTAMRSLFLGVVALQMTGAGLVLALARFI